MFPELKVKHQSILHDYIFRSAYKAQSVKAKNQLYKWLLLYFLHFLIPANIIGTFSALNSLLWISSPT